MILSGVSTRISTCVSTCVSTDVSTDVPPTFSSKLRFTPASPSPSIKLKQGCDDGHFIVHKELHHMVIVHIYA